VRLLDHLPILVVVVPMLTAPLCVVLRHARATWGVAMAVTWGAFATAVHLLYRVHHEGVLSYEVGGWPPPWGIELRFGLLNTFVLVIVTAISAIVLSSAPWSLEGEVPRERQYLFYAAFLLCMTGLAGMTSAGDAFNVFVFLEISALSSYALIAQGPSPRALTSAFRYLVMGTVGGTFFLLGLGMLYMVTGTLNMVDLAARLADAGANRTVLVALACIVVGIGIKVAIFPLHNWLPDAYTFAPAMVSAFLAATATKVAYYALANFVFRIFGKELVFDQLGLDKVLMPLALAAMFIASTVAIFERDVKRLLAYSSLAQIGYMVLGLSFASKNGLTGGIVHLFNHAMTKSALFLALAAVMLRIGSTQLDDMRGLGKRMPLTMAAFVVAGLSLIGVPLTAGFISKWYLVLAALESGRWPIAVLILLSSLLAVIYVGRVIEVAYFSAPPEGAELIAEAPWGILIPTWILVAATIYFGISTQATAAVAQRAAELLVMGQL
jgi:multicomponent Na+:H+ antiporter subunit D